MFRVDDVVGPAVITRFKERGRHHSDRLRAQRLCQGQLIKSIRALLDAGVLALTLDSEEAKELVLDKWSTDASAELLTTVGGICVFARLRMLIGIERLVAEEAEE